MEYQMIYLDEQSIAVAKKLGHGNLSAGVREALRYTDKCRIEDREDSKAIRLNG